MEVTILSETHIKPSSPTPPHLKTYKFSGMDQRSTSSYVPTVFFYNSDDTRSIHETASSLKRSLSETLTLFYPFAGKTQSGNVSVDCTDDGAYYVEARAVGPTLSQYLSHDVVRDLTTLKMLLPLSDGVRLYGQPAAGSHLLLVKVTFFPCGGLAVGLVFSHKVADGPSFASFLRAWAAAAAVGGGGGVSNCCRPLLSAEAVFPQNEAFVETAAVPQAAVDRRRLPQFIRAQTVPGAVRRFVFNTSAIANLKEISKSPDAKTHPSRVQAVTALIIKSILRAFESRSDITGTTLIVQPVNLRTRANPPLSHNLFGNLIWRASFPLFDHDHDHNQLVSLMKESVSKFDSELMNKTQGDEGKDRFVELAREMDEDEGNADRHIMCNSFSRLGCYEIDFGWGKPVWFACVCADESVPVMVNTIVVNDTRSGEGLEAWVFIGQDDMSFLDKDEELLSFVTGVDSNPLDLP